MTVGVNDIKVGRRVRSDAGDLEPLMDSMRRNGLLHPITVNAKNELVAGGRRLEAAKRLGWKTIDAIALEGNDRAREIEIEIEENTVRAALTDKDLMNAYRRLEKAKNPSVLTRAWRAICAFFSGFSRKK